MSNIQWCPCREEDHSPNRTTAYCEAGEAKCHECKRYLVKAKYGKYPGDLLPNSNLTLEEIATRYQLAAL